MTLPVALTLIFGLPLVVLVVVLVAERRLRRQDRQRLASFAQQVREWERSGQ